MIALVSSSSAEETKKAVARLTHYGKYSFMHFLNGAIQKKEMLASQSGLRLPLFEKPAGISLTHLQDFEALVEELSKQRVVYIGETHTSRADHLLQYLLIEALHRKNPNIAIGMEMFPRSSQPALDAFIHEKESDEAEFLAASNYYNVWGYDYRLFRPIMRYARKHQLRNCFLIGY